MSIHVGWPQGIAIAFIILNLVMGAVLDGEPKTGNYKFSITLVGAMLNVALLYWGGFFG